MVDTTKRSDAAAAAAAPSKLAAIAPTKPAAADLDARFRALMFEDRTAMRRPQPEPRQQAPAPTVRSDVRQQFETTVRQYWPPQPRSREVGESSAAAECYASSLGTHGTSSSSASHYGDNSPRCNEVATTSFPCVSKMIAASRPLAPPPSMPSTSNNPYQPSASASQHGAFTAEWDHNVSLNNPFASAPPAAMPEGLSQNGSINLSAYHDLSRNGSLNSSAYHQDLSRNGSLNPSGYQDLSHNGSINLSAYHDHNRNGIIDLSTYQDFNRDGSLNPSAYHQDLSHNGSVNPSAYQDLSHNDSLNLSAYHDLSHSGSLYPSAYQLSTPAARHANASTDLPYPPAFESGLHATQAVGNHPWAVQRFSTLEEVRSSLRGVPMHYALATCPQTSALVVLLLQEGSEEVRRSVLYGVRTALPRVVDSREGLDVLRALIGACCRFDELHDIVLALCSSKKKKKKSVLTDVMNHNNGVSALMDLIAAVAPYPHLSSALVLWFLTDGLYTYHKCADLVRQCFDMMPYDDCCSYMVLFARCNVNKLLMSSYGSMFLGECYKNAKKGEFGFLEGALPDHVCRLAMGQYSNYFLQQVLEYGSSSLKERIAERVAADVVTLSLDKFGSYVVEACLHPTRSLRPLQHVLAVFLDLPSVLLGDLVRDDHANYVVKALLAACLNDFPREAEVLARRIEALPAEVREDLHAQQVTRFIKKNFSKGRVY